jgi:hypothetical protein
MCSHWFAGRQGLSIWLDLAPRFQSIRVYLDPVGIATLPENYEDRLAEVFPVEFERLRLFALDPYDIASPRSKETPTLTAKT